MACPHRKSLWEQSDAELLKQVLPPQTLTCTPGGLLHCGPGGEGFGLQTALRASHPDRIKECLSLAQSMVCKPKHAGRFKMERSIAVVSPRAWLGTLSPFLCGLQVVEFCYIRAPPGCLEEVLQVYAKLVLSELSELDGKDGLTPYTVHLGPGGKWGMQQVAAFPTRFQECFMDALRQKHPVHLQVLQAQRGIAQWRFLPLQKHFVLYCLHEDGSTWLCLPHHNPLFLYQAVFTSMDQAALHLRTVGQDPFSSGSLQEVTSEADSQITDSFLRGETLQGYRLVALRCLVTGEEACLPDCWRMCHSVCAQLEFLSAVAECLQGLLELCEEGEQSAAGQTAIPYQAAIEEMSEGLSWLLKRTLQHPEALAPPGVWETVLNWRESVARGSRAVCVRGVVGVCQAVSEGLFRDLHSLCHQVQALLDRLGTAGEVREVRTQVCCTKMVPPHSQSHPHGSSACHNQNPSHNVHRTGAQALELF
ncbi:hypothetical protein MATL_G00005320 [Megalops atlanticus]|uniref:Uncharacterized protein n=1 Tax=Megalops atlanticus TaxID=7932 RepID=A0A9D3QGC2_MEGAT|nr:hypothetical protein MATL_G00005320 [Megalops atlanticus]